ncbi:lamin tail domain-containing protein [Candidatus Parcubacteria bacterium]|nr:lamin tail domain-containing protein [Candidatus Parcubacteria bacterium]
MKNRLIKGGKKVLQCFLILLVIFPLNLMITPSASASELPPQPQAGEVIINEIMPDPSVVSDSNGEWFEVYNNTDHQVNLINCIIKDDGSDLHTINLDLIIDSNDYAVLTKNSTSTENGGIISNYTYTGITLANEEDELILICNDTEIDRVEYNKDSGWVIKVGESMILSDFNFDNNITANWCLSTSSYGDGDLGTPGITNDQCEYNPVCGDEILEENEKCDDGNNQNGDGCSSDCQIESIYGYKFNDLNKDGIMGEGEPMLGGWVIELYDNASSTIPTTTITTSIANSTLGFYSFQNLEAGGYVIKEVQQDGWLQTTPTTSTTTIKLESPTATTTVNFGNWEYKTISGYKYYDSDRDGVMGGGEIGISGWTITLTNSSTTATTTTDTEGYYEFNNLDIGDYTITEIMLDNWHRTDLFASSTPTTTPIEYHIEYSATTTSTSTINFGNWQTEIYGYKFNDLDKNGEFDDGEEKMAGWEIELYNAANATSSIDKTTTDAEGNYIFKGHPFGDYWVKEFQQDGWMQTNLASTTATTTISTATITAEVNFGNWEYKIISGYKYNDLDRDGEWDISESGIGDWMIKLYDNASSTNPILINSTATDTATTSTTTLGCYEFNELEPGVYMITEVMRENWMTGVESAPTTTPIEHNIIITATSTTPTSTADINFYNWQYDCVDNDDDGYYSNESDIECGEKDCDDNNADINPLAKEICGNSIDENCDGKIESCGGGGGHSNFLTIHSEKLVETKSKIEDETEFATETITWHTNKPATSRVVYGTLSVADIGEWPNLGYQYSTTEDLNKITFHEVVISGLLPNTTYYFRTISAASPAIYGKELFFTTPQLSEPQEIEDEQEDEPEDDKGEIEEEGEKGEDEAGDSVEGADESSQEKTDGGGIIGEGAQAAAVVVLGEKLALVDDLPDDILDEDSEKDEAEEDEKEQGIVGGEKIIATTSADSEDGGYDCWSEWWWLIILLLLIIAYFAYENYRIKEESRESEDIKTSPDSGKKDNE